MKTTLAFMLLTIAPLIAAGEEPAWPLLVSEDFENGADRWQPFDEEVWRIEESGGGHIYSQHQNTTNYNPPHRSPFLISLFKDVTVSDFDLRVRVKSTFKDYDHRDACLVFGFQDPKHFYYVHFGKRADDHANQIFVVDDAPRTRISTTSTDGTPWTDQWHHVRIVRRAQEGTIEVYFDDLEKPVMTASDQRFLAGQIGLGSFDDTTQWDDFELYGVKQEVTDK